MKRVIFLYFALLSALLADEVEFSYQWIQGWNYGSGATQYITIYGDLKEDGTVHVWRESQLTSSNLVTAILGSDGFESRGVRIYTGAELASMTFQLVLYYSNKRDTEFYLSEPIQIVIDGLEGDNHQVCGSYTNEQTEPVTVSSVATRGSEVLESSSRVVQPGQTIEVCVNRTDGAFDLFMAGEMGDVAYEIGQYSSDSGGGFEEDSISHTITDGDSQVDLDDAPDPQNPDSVDSQTPVDLAKTGDIERLRLELRQQHETDRQHQTDIFNNLYDNLEISTEVVADEIGNLQETVSAENELTRDVLTEMSDGLLQEVTVNVEDSNLDSIDLQTFVDTSDGQEEIDGNTEALSFVEKITSLFPEFPELPAAVTGRKYDYHFDFGSYQGEPLQVDFDLTPYSTWIELFRNVILLVCVVTFWFKVAQLVKSAFAGT